MRNSVLSVWGFVTVDGDVHKLLLVINQMNRSIGHIGCE